MYSRSTLHLVGKLSYVWDVVGTVHISPRNVPAELRMAETKSYFNSREFRVNELEESAGSREVGRRINIKV